MNFSFDYPEALLLGALFAFVFYRVIKRKSFLRWLFLLLAILLISGPSIDRSNTQVDIVAVIDRSRSIAPEDLQRQAEILDNLQDNLETGDRIAVVSYSEKAYLEQPLMAITPSKEFKNTSSSDRSNMADGLETALNIIQPKRQTRIVLLSDGDFTGRDPITQASLARRLETPIFYRLFARMSSFNLGIADAYAPDKVITGEPFRISFVVESSEETTGQVRLRRNGEVVPGPDGTEWREMQFVQGSNRVAFNDVSTRAGTAIYNLDVQGPNPDQEVFRNDNTTQLPVSILGEKPVLVVNPTGQADNLSNVLSAGNLQIEILGIKAYRLSRDALDQYKAVVLNNVSILDLSRGQVSALADFVEHGGGGLVVTGGNASFARGGYYRSALDPILPVNLDDRRVSMKMSTAMAINMDRSGSMSAPAAGARDKLEVAARAAYSSIETMSARDSISILVTDTESHVILPQQTVEDPSSLEGKVLSIRPQGGGISIYPALLGAGAQIMDAPQANKHILLFADSSDSTDERNYPDLLRQFREAGITVSVVGMGKNNDPHAPLLTDVAAKGGGSIYFTDDMAKLIQFFSADTLTYSRNNFIEDPVSIVPRIGAQALSSDQSWKPFTASHYNIMYPRPEAQMALQTTDEHQSAILAFWQKGLGRCVTLALDTERTFAQAPGYADTVLNVVRYATGSNVYDSFHVRNKVQGNLANIEVELSDEERAAYQDGEYLMFAPDGTSTTHALRWTGPNTLVAEVEMIQPGIHRGVVKAGDKVFSVSPMAITGSPEMLVRNTPEQARRNLEQLAEISRGAELTDASVAFERKSMSVDKSPLHLPLVLILLIVLLLEIADHRFRWVSYLVSRMRMMGLLPAKMGATVPGTEPADMESPHTARVKLPKVKIKKSGMTSLVNRSKASAEKPAQTKPTTTPPAPQAAAPTSEPPSESPPPSGANTGDMLRRARKDAAKHVNKQK